MAHDESLPPPGAQTGFIHFKVYLYYLLDRNKLIVAIRYKVKTQINN